MSNEPLSSDNKLISLITFCYEKYKHKMSETERKVCEEYLLQWEFELALDNLLAILGKHNIELDAESAKKIQEAKDMMGLK
jgi:hypothetical protein